MQIIVNTRLLIENRLDGIGWFSYQTLKRITRQNPDVHFVFLFDRPCSETFIFSDNITPVILGPKARHPFLYYAWFQFSVKNLLNKMRPDLFLSPDGFLSLGAHCKQLPVIHDINFLHYPQDSKWLTARYYNHFFPKFAQHASRVATVSEFSKSELVTHYRIPSDKIDVVYNGIHDFFRPLTDIEKTQTRERFSQGKNYFVSVGSLHPRKNVARLIEAFGLFKKESRSDLKLILAGPGFWGLAEIHKAVENSGASQDIVFTGRLMDEDLTLVLGAAEALTFVPYYEGFGIPLVEAMAAEVPIITSNLSSLPEIAGEAALQVNPFEVNEIKNAMLAVHQNNALKRSLIEKGKFQREKFSWDKSAEQLWSCILKTVS